MQTSKLSRWIQGVALATTVAIAGVSTSTVAMAQATGATGAQGTGTAGGTGTGGGMGQTTENYGETDDGMDLGWVGLLGLAGLLGLRRRNTTMHHTDTTTSRRV